MSLTLYCTAQLPNEYSGKFKEHPKFTRLKEIAQMTLSEAQRDLPPRLGTSLPSVKIEFVDLSKPFTTPLWLGNPPDALRVERRGSTLYWTIRLPVQFYISSPERIREVIIFELIKISVLQTSDETLVFGPMDIPKATGGETLIDAYASYLAGLMEREISFVFSMQLAQGKNIRGLVGEIGTSVAKEQNNTDDLTFHFLMRMLYENGADTTLQELRKLLQRTQPLEGSLRKITKKNSLQINQELQKNFEEYLRRNFPPAQEILYTEIAQLFTEKNYFKCVDKSTIFLHTFPKSLVGGNVLFMRGRALAELRQNGAEDALRDLLIQYPWSTPFAADAQFYLGLLALEKNKIGQARQEFTKLLEDFAWDQLSVDRATEYLNKL